MAGLGEIISGAVSGLVAPIAGVFAKREERHAAKDAIQGALVGAQQAGAQEVVVNDQHLELVMADANKSSWKDEYVTLSVVGIINGIMLGGVLQGFGYPEFLAGVRVGVDILLQAGVDLSFILNATIMAAIGLNIWRKA